jgi:hypothetical protein
VLAVRQFQTGQLPGHGPGRGVGDERGDTHPVGVGEPQLRPGWLSRPAARCRCYHRSVSAGRSPNPACASPRTGLSTVSAVRRGWPGSRDSGSCLPRYRYRAVGTRPRLNSSTPSADGIRHRPLRPMRCLRRSAQLTGVSPLEWWGFGQVPWSGGVSGLKTAGPGLSGVCR